MKRKTLLILGVILIIGVVLGWYFAKRHRQLGQNAVQIGWIGPLTGDASPYGKAIKNGTDLAVEDITAKGGAGGRMLRVIYEDDQLNPKLGVSAMQKLLSIDKTPAVIQAAGSSVMLANVPIAEENKIVYISPSCSSDKIKSERVRLNAKYIFRTWPSDSYQGQVLSSFAHDNLKAKTAAVLYINNDYGTGLREVFIDSFKKLGGKIVAEEGYAEGTNDFRTQLSKVSQANPEVIFIPSHFQEAAQLLKQAKELGVKAQFISDAALFSPELIKIGRNAVEGLIVSNPQWDPSSQDPFVKSFVDAYKHRYNEVPDVYAAAGYDCMRVIGHAIAQGGTSSEGIRNALATTKDFPGVTGKISFDQFGEVEANYSFFMIQSGSFIPYR